LNVGLGPAFATWAGTVLPDGARVLLVLDRPEDLWEAVWQLLRIGYPPPQGWLAGGMAAWRTSGRPVGFLPQLTVEELYGRLDRDETDLLDVRQPAEWAGGHVPGAVHVTGAELPGRVGEVPGSRPLAVMCGSGYRSSVAASLLAHRGRTGVHNVTGGMAAWTAAGLPVVPPGAR
ncbi:MAG: rhodanese-like domain-containing protein, partial [Actinomycetes bacterium]